MTSLETDDNRQHTHKVEAVRHQDEHSMSLDDANPSHARR